MKNKKSEIPEVQEAMKHVYHETRKDKLKNGLLNVVGCIGGFIAMVLVGIALSNLSDNDNIVGHFFSFLLSKNRYSRKGCKEIFFLNNSNIILIFWNNSLIIRELSFYKS